MPLVLRRSRWEWPDYTPTQEFPSPLCRPRPDSLRNAEIQSIDTMTVIAAECQARAIVFVRLSEVVGRPMKEPRHAGHDQLPHVRRFGLLVGFSKIAVDGIAHLRVHRSAIQLPSSIPQVGLR